MMSVLRVAAESFDVDAFLAAHKGMKPDAVWHIGERRTSVTTRRTNGLNLFIAEEPEWKRLLQRTMDSLEAIRRDVDDARDAGARVELDFALEAGENDKFTISALFAPQELRALSDAAISLCVTVYPPSRKEEPQER